MRDQWHCIYAIIFYMEQIHFHTWHAVIHQSHEEAQFLKASTFHAGRALYSYPLITCNTDHSKAHTAPDSLIKVNTVANKPNA